MDTLPKAIALCLFAAFSTTVLGVVPSEAGDPPRKYTRRSLHEFFKDPKKVESLVKGVREMKRRSSADPNSAEFRTSWLYWANIHGYVGEGPRAGFGVDGFRTLKEVRQAVITEIAPELGDIHPFLDPFYFLNDEIKDQKPTDKLAEDSWSTCPHGDPFFLPWHRMYLYFFERTLRKASGDPDFALPYWDYTNSETNRGPQGQLLASPWMIPRQFALPKLEGDSLPNPLFEPRRTAGFGSVVQVSLEQTNIDFVLKNDSFSRIVTLPDGRRQDVGFQVSLESGLHGYIHCLVGVGCLAPYIGLVPLAGNDPVFWHHHANLDRLWSCWLRTWGAGSSIVSQDPAEQENWLEQTYFFPNENGDRDSMTVRELFKTDGRIDFVYDNETDCRRDKTEVVAAARAADAAAATPTAAAEPVRTEAGSASNVRVTATNQRVPLFVPPDAAGARERLRTAAQPSGPRWRRALLTLTGVTTERAPGASVSVYLENVKTGNRAFAGIMSFFHRLGHEHAGGSAGTSFGFEVSAQLRELLGKNGGGDSVQVLLVAEGQVVGSPEVSAKLYQQAGMRIGEIKLVLE